MKTTIWLKSVTGGLAALPGGAILASAQTGGTYIVDPFFTNDPAPMIVYVWGLPTLSGTPLNPDGYGVTTTDGAGRIDGVWDLTVTNLSAFGNSTTGQFIVDIAGNLKSVGSKPPVSSVKMTVKGGGFIEDTNGTTQTEASINFNFSGNLSNLTSSVGPFVNTNIHEVFLNADGTTNFEFNTTAPDLTTNTVVENINDVGYSWLSFYVNYSANLVTNNNTNVLQHNEAYFDEGQDLLPATFDSLYIFGTVVDTNPVGSNVFSFALTTNSTTVVVTQVFNVFGIGTNIHFKTTTTGGVTVTNNNDAFRVDGFDIAQLGAFVNAYRLGRFYELSNSLPPTNFVVRAVTTNVVAADSSSTTTTNISDPTTFDDSWFEMTGLAKGTIKAGKVSQSLNSQTVTFNQSHSLFSSAAGTNNDIVVFDRQVNGNNNWYVGSINNIVPSTKVNTIGKKLFLSTQNIMSIGMSGKGTINPTKHTYTAKLTGKAFGRGSSFSIKGDTGPLAVNVVSNFVTITNIAAFPEVSVLASNPPAFTPFNYMNVLTNVVGTNEIVATNFWRSLPIPEALSTNIPDAIQTINLNGKLLGQKVLANGFSD